VKIGKSGSMSGMWKRSHSRTTKVERGGNRYVRPTATAPHSDLYEVAAVKGIFRSLILMAPGYGVRRASSLAARVKRCVKGAGLEGAPKSVTSSCKYFPTLPTQSLLRSEASPLHGVRRSRHQLISGRV
jgi:hypothetical protein